MKLARPLGRTGARPTALRAGLLEVPLCGLAVGELCELRSSSNGSPNQGGIVLSVRSDGACVAVLGSSQGLSCRTIVMPTGRCAILNVSETLLGCVLDANGCVTERLAETQCETSAPQWRELATAAVDYRQRATVLTPLQTGVRVIDGLLTCGEGQRIGIFAGAGSGKSTLLEMIQGSARADVLVIALIGERGRELAEAVERARQSSRAARTIIVHATSDMPSALRCQATQMAVTIAEYFRDQGHHVLLMIDSITRYARALRDLALASGEPPARRGYPASVFEALPTLLERPGATRVGCITAFCTVLIEDEDMADPIGEEVKSLLDGHVYLSSRLAGKGRFPAVDVLASSSRLFHTLVDEPHARMARSARQWIGHLKDLEWLREVGEYVPGANPEHDHAIALEPQLLAFLSQDRRESSPWRDTLEQMRAFEP